MVIDRRPHGYNSHLQKHLCSGFHPIPMSNRKDDGTETAWLGSGGHVIISGNMGMQSVVKITNQAQNAHDIKLTVLLQLL